jgi:hypothetical protein
VTDPALAARAERFNIPVKEAPVEAGAAAVAPAAKKEPVAPREPTEEEKIYLEKCAARSAKFGVPDLAGDKLRAQLLHDAVAANKKADQEAKRAQKEAGASAKAEADRARALAAEEDKKRKRQDRFKEEVDPELAAKLEARQKRFASGQA